MPCSRTRKLLLSKIAMSQSWGTVLASNLSSAALHNDVLEGCLPYLARSSGKNVFKLIVNDL